MKYDQDYYVIQQKKYLIFLINFTFQAIVSFLYLLYNK